MDQTTLTVFTPIKRGELDSLRALLNTIGDDIPGHGQNRFIRCSELSTLHFARWVIVPGDADRGIPDQLAFESNFDGDTEEFLDELARKAEAGLDQIYAKCEGYPGIGTSGLPAFKKYFADHSTRYSARYIAYRGRRVHEIRNNTRLRQLVEGFLDREDRSGTLDSVSAVEIQKRIQEFLRQAAAGEPGLETQPLETNNRWKPVLLSVTLLAAALVLFPFPVFWAPLPLAVRIGVFLIPLTLLAVFLIVLRIHERADRQMAVRFVSVDDAIFHRENRQVQNQLTHLVDIKPGRFRLYTLKAVLAVINFAAKFYWYKGTLGTIPTIHFARWLIIDNNRRLIFFSNFDGSWENYLGDFIDKASVGLTAVWSNTVGFPRADFLVGKGATDEERFKEWARQQQIPTQVWYTAHPDETVRNILDNFLIRNGISRARPEEEVKKWLQLF